MPAASVNDLGHAVQEGIVGLRHRQSPCRCLYGRSTRRLTQAAKQRDLPPMILAILPFPHIDPVLVQSGAARHPLVCPGLYRRRCCWAGGAWSRMLRQKSLWANPPFNGKPPATEDQIGDLVVWATFGVILGGRLGWDLIYGVLPVQRLAAICRFLPRPADGLPHQSHPAHRGLGRRHVVSWRRCSAWCSRSGCSAGGASSASSWWAIWSALVAPIGLFFGRLANFVNGELWGRATDVPWAMVFPRAPATCRAIPASSTKPRSKAFCCSSSCRSACACSACTSGRA